MKMNNLTKVLPLAIMAASFQANAESQYPAANFEPVIISQDAALISKHSEVTKTTAAEPVKSVTSSSAKSESYASAKSQPTPTEDSNLPLILVGLGVAAAGYWFTKKSGNKSTTVSQAYSAPVVAAPAPVSGGTGVSRYVDGLTETPSATKTGVDRYIQSIPASAPAKTQTGVEKYLKTLPENVKPAAGTQSSAPASSGPTGVEKYLNSLPQAPKAATETGVAKYLKSQGLAA